MEKTLSSAATAAEFTAADLTAADFTPIPKESRSSDAMVRPSVSY